MTALAGQQSAPSEAAFPRPTGEGGAKGKLGQRFAVLLAALGLMLAASFGLTLTFAYQVDVDRHTETAEYVVQLAEVSLTRTLQSTESALYSVADRIIRTAYLGSIHDPWPTNRVAAVVQSIQDAIAASPYIHQISLVDEDGHIIVDNFGAPRVQRTGADVERQRLDLSAIGLGPEGMGGPTEDFGLGLTIGAVTAAPYLPLIGGHIAPDSYPSSITVAVTGSPTVQVVAAVRLESFRNVLVESAQVGDGSVMLLTWLDGTVIMSSHGSIDGLNEFDLTASLLDAIDDGLRWGVIQSPDEAAAAHFRLSGHYPLAVVSLFDRGEASTLWLDRYRWFLLWAFLALIGAGLVGGLLIRESLRRQRLERLMSVMSLTDLAFAHSAEAMVIVDERDRIVSSNPTFSRLTGVDQRELVGMRSDFCLNPIPDDRALFQGENLSADHGDIMMLCHRKGDLRYVEVKRAPLVDGMSISTMADLTELWEANAALEEALRQAEGANRAKSEFLASASHELRTPMNAILGFAEIIRERAAGPIGNAVYEEYIEHIHESGAQLLEVINDLLDLERIESGSFEPKVEAVDLYKTIQTCMRVFAERANKLDLEFACWCPSDLPSVMLDERALRQILFNLLSNAIKYTPRAGSVVVDVTLHPGEYVRIAVSDTGIGISEDDTQRIFSAYSQAMNLLTRDFEGTGLGLALVKALVLKLGGEIIVRSALGQGTTMALFFPQQGGKIGREVIRSEPGTRIDLS